MKLFIGLLIIAAGAGFFLLLRNKKTEAGDSIKKELIVGKWKLDSIGVRSNDSAGEFISFIAATDSNFYKYRYEVRSNGNILQSVVDSVKADTSYYEWTKKNELAWKENSNDSTTEVFTVAKLSSENLLLQSKDSATFHFTKLK